MNTPASKAAWRERLSASRRALDDEARTAARAAICDHVLRRVSAAGWACVAAYEPLRTEPGSVDLLDGLAELGVRVLVPITLADRDLDWSAGGAALGPNAIAAADAVLVPALAVAADGTRLGRGGGSYDRALRRCRAGVPRAALLYESELVGDLPRDDWDEPVTAVVRPSGWVEVPGLAPAG